MPVQQAKAGCMGTLGGITLTAAGIGIGKRISSGQRSHKSQIVEESYRGAFLLVLTNIAVK